MARLTPTAAMKSSASGRGKVVGLTSILHRGQVSSLKTSLYYTAIGHARSLKIASFDRA